MLTTPPPPTADEIAGLEEAMRYEVLFLALLLGFLCGLTAGYNLGLGESDGLPGSLPWSYSR